MSVRAKFKVSGFEVSTGYDPDNKTVELRTVKLQPVYGNGDPDHENTKFWRYTPTGEINLGTVNPAAWKQFELGQEYYVDFTKAD